MVDKSPTFVPPLEFSAIEVELKAMSVGAFGSVPPDDVELPNSKAPLSILESTVSLLLKSLSLNGFVSESECPVFFALLLDWSLKSLAVS